MPQSSTERQWIFADGIENLRYQIESYRLYSWFNNQIYNRLFWIVAFSVMTSNSLVSDIKVSEERTALSSDYMFLPYRTLFFYTDKNPINLLNYIIGVKFLTYPSII
jgi:hypothetical protein